MHIFRYTFHMHFRMLATVNTATSTSAAIRPEFQLVLFIYSEKYKQEKYWIMMMV